MTFTCPNCRRENKVAGWTHHEPSAEGRRVGERIIECVWCQYRWTPERTRGVEESDDARR